MEKYDFIFIYEHKVRELENLCLMKYELDSRGYRTKIIYIDDAKNAMYDRPIYHTKVLCTMACYDNYTLFWHTKQYIRFDKVIDLQWENVVYTKDENREGAYKNYTGVGRDVVHISWGKQNYKRLHDVAHLDPRKIMLTGHVGMDFLREPLSRYYLSRSELFKKYNMDESKKIVLFASPYYGDSLSEDYISGMCERFGEDWIQYYDFMLGSQKVVLEWFDEVCSQDENLVIVYRPHPGHPSKIAEQLEEKHSNFRIISSESVKQWILACDRVYTGNSTVVVEAYFANKDCQLLFPLEITDGFELKLIKDSQKITDFEEFYRTIYSDENEFPTPRSSIEEIYLIDNDKPSYVRFADAAEEVIRDKYYSLSWVQRWAFKEYSFSEKLVRVFTHIPILYDMYLALLDTQIHTRFLDKQREKRKQGYEYSRKVEETHAHELTSDEEINSIIKRIEYAINCGGDNE